MRVTKRRFLRKEDEMDKFKKVKVIGNIIGFNIDASAMQNGVRGYEQGKFEGAFEREKLKIPQFVVDWIEYCKFTHVDLQHALIVGDVYFYNYANQKDFSKLKEFLETENNQATFARAWLDGYEVEKEKRYEVSIKASGQYLARTKLKEIAFMYNGACSRFTRKELEDADFGWVFDCEGVEVQEVE